MPVTQVNNRLIKDAAITGVKLSIVTTKGDVLGFDTVADRIPVGTNRMSLLSDSTNALGVSWGYPLSSGFTSTTPGSPANGDVWYNTTSAAPAIETPSGVGFIPRILYINTNGSNVVSNTATETTFTNLYQLPANSTVAGSTYRIRAWGVYSTTGTPTLIIRGRYNASIVYQAGTFSSVTNAAAQRWFVEFTVQILTTGASGTFSAAGMQGYGGNTFVPSSGSGSADTTVANNVGITWQWSAASTSNTAQMNVITIEQLL